MIFRIHKSRIKMPYIYADLAWHEPFFAAVDLLNDLSQ